jgi:GT2 family glycosyltransferase
MPAAVTPGARRTDLHDDRDVECTSGALIVTRRDVLQEVGFLDESVFMYLEDIDFCRRVRQAGYRIRYLGSRFAWHDSGVSARGAESALFELMPQVWLTYLARYGTTLEKLLARPALALLCIVTALRRLTSRQLPIGELRAVRQALTFKPSKNPVW